MATAELSYDERGVGQPLVLVHGFPFDRTIWDGRFRELSDAVHVVVPDLPGFGESPMSGDEASMEGYAEAIAALIRKLDLGKVVLGGHSMGGYAVMAFMREYADLVSGLLLICTRPGPDTEAAREGRYRLASAVDGHGSGAASEAMLPRLFAPETYDRNPAVVEYTERVMRRQPSEGVAAALRAMAVRPDSTPGLGEIEVPALIITGAQDAIIPAGDAGLMLAEIPGSRHVELDAGHMPMLEDTSGFTRAVLDFASSIG